MVLALLSIALHIAISPWVPADIPVLKILLHTFHQQCAAFLFSFLVVACIIINIRLLIGGVALSTLLYQYFIERLSALLIICLCILNFSIFKQTIPAVVPFQWDPLLYHIDTMILGGNLITAWLNTYFPVSILEYCADMCYASWAAISGVILLWRGLCQDNQQRLHFQIAWLLCWILLGSIAAMAFSSVGPCFYTTFYHHTPPDIHQLFPPQHNGSLLTDSAKQVLLASAIKHDYAMGMGISAFPSLHVATSVINALTLATTSRLLGQLGWLYVAAVSISAAYLGFHYVIDCLVAIAGAYGIWRFTNYLLRYYD